MRKRICHIVLMLWVVGPLAAQVTGPAIAQTVGHLTCEQLTDPKGIDVLHPRLSWQIDSGRQDLRQTAWQVMVASTEENLAAGKADRWNSGRVEGDQSWLVPYAGLPLKSRMTCYWKVRVWTTSRAAGSVGPTETTAGGLKSTETTAGAWSAPAQWTVGLLHPLDWKARWIGYDRGFSWDSLSKFSRLSARYFRKEFDAGPSIRSATLYVIGLGHYIVSINGHEIGDQVLAEAPTDYTRSVRYNTFDVTTACRAGANAIGVVLGNGRFFTMRPRYKPQKIKEFGFPKLLLQLEIVDDSGRRRQIISDSSWRFTADGPIRSNNEYDGEEVDARRDLTGWSLPGYDDSRWLRPRLVAAPGGRLLAQMDPPIKVMATIKPVSIRQIGNSWILDLGQNIAGWLQIKVKGERGREITLRYAESLQHDGSLYTANLRDARVTDKYTLSGNGEEVWHPVFVFHGFRYVAIDNYPGHPSPDDFEGQVVYDDLPDMGVFQCSDSTLNKIFRNAWWSIADNYKGMPIDCPQRNERMPWLGDRATGSLGESYLFGNSTLYAKWLDDIEESQRPNGQLPDVAPAYWNYYSDNMTWPGVYLLVADMLYEQYADLRPIQRHYASMKRWLRYMTSRYEKDGIMTKDKYGDWCVPPESPELIHSKDSLRNTDGQLIATAYYYHLLQLMSHFADLLHKPADAADFSLSAKKTKRAFNARYLVAGKDAHYANNTVTANLLPLYFGMTPGPDRGSVFAHVIDKIEKKDQDHISTGVIGTQWLMRTLTLYGRADLAYRIAGNKTYPGWGYMVEHGATTIWELWNGDSANPSMNSQNHVMLLGDLLTWYFQDLAGIAPGAPGFKRIRMQPVFPEGLQYVRASYRTPYGVVESHWEKRAGVIVWDFTVPPNTTADIILPGREQEETGSGVHHLEIKSN